MSRNVLVRPVARRQWRGATLLVTLMFALPMMLFGGMLSVDLSRVVVTNRQVASAAEYAAVAGAQEFEPGVARLVPADAEAAAYDAFERATNRGAHNARINDVTVVADQFSVEITVDYETDMLGILPLMSRVLGSDFDSTIERDITRTAFLCDPRDLADPTLGYCARPRS